MGGSWFSSRVGPRVSLRFHFFVSDVNQRNEGAGCIQDIPAWLQG